MDEEPKIERLQVAIQRDADDDADFPLAQLLWINHDDQHFYLRFYQVVPPIVQDGVAPGHVRARLVSSFCIPADLAPAIVRALQDSARKYEHSTGHTLNWQEGTS